MRPGYIILCCLLFVVVLKVPNAAFGQLSPAAVAHGGNAQPDEPAIISKKALLADKVSVVSVGDILLGDAATPYLSRHGNDWPFEQVQSLLENADLVMGNLEGPLTTATEPLSARKKYSYKVPPDTVWALKRAGFDAFSLANNHALDFGVAGMRDTISTLQAAGMASFGAGENEVDARRGIIYQFGTLKIGLLSYGQEWNETRGIGWEAEEQNPGCALLSAQNLTEDIARLRRHADLVMVSMHWGRNYKDVTNEQRRMGRLAIELGADVVQGHHPHIAQGIEIYQGRPIVYSLGNFVFGTPGRYPQNTQGYGLVARYVIQGKKLKWLLLTPIAVNNKLVNYQPRRVAAEEAHTALRRHIIRFGAQARWREDTAFIGFDPNWQTAPLPATEPIENPGR